MARGTGRFHGAGFALAVAGVLALAAGLRLAALGAEFWFDEVWSWELARSAGPAWRAFFGLRHDNNHPLNTLFLSCCPDGLPWGWYRAHSLAAGVLSVGLAVLVARPWGRAEALFAGLLTATCCWLVLCSAEARGYALAVCFALLAVHALGRHLDRGGRAALALFWLAAGLGFWSHLTFLHAYLGLLLWSLRHFARHRDRPGGELAPLVRCHAVPCLSAGLLYLGVVRGMELGGGPPVPAGEVLARLLALGLGGPGGALGLPWALAGVSLAGWGLWRLARSGGDDWVFFAVTVFAAPALFLLKRPPFLFERYFLIPFVFFLLLLAYALGALWRRGCVGSALALAALALAAGGGVRHDAEFARAGRGRFHEALAFVEGHDAGPTVTVGGDHDFRVRKLCSFYIPYLQSCKKYVYLPEGPGGGARWLFVHRLDDRHPPGEVLAGGRGNEYRLARAYPPAGPGCWGWYVYERAGAAHASAGASRGAGSASRKTR